MRGAEPIIATENSRHNYVYKKKDRPRLVVYLNSTLHGEPGRLCKFYIEQQSIIVSRTITFGRTAILQALSEQLAINNLIKMNVNNGSA